MKWEYLLLNAIIISGPLALSFDRRVRFVQYWRFVFPAILIVMIPFIIWDALVSGRHWWFNHAYTIDFRLLGLPAGEWLFFITVPYACIFTWEVLIEYFGNRTFAAPAFRLKLGFFVLLPVSFFAFLWGKEYTALSIASLALVFLTDKFLNTNLFFQSRTYYFLGLLTVMMLVFNGYLTGRPVVLYDSAYQLDIRILSIPIEDFWYGYALILHNLVVYEWLKRKRDEH